MSTDRPRADSRSSADASPASTSPADVRSRLGRVSVVLWDLDGTLINSIELIRSAFDHALRTVFGLKLPPDELIKNIGIPLRGQIEAFTAGMDVDRAKIDEALHVYQSYHDQRHDSMSNEYPGATDTLAELSRRGYRQGVVTSRRRISSERSLELNDMGRFFEVVVAMEDVTEYKPLPRPILAALEQMEAEPDDAIYVGDSPFDVLSARAAGVLVAAALWGPFPHERLFAEEPDIALSDVRAVADILPDAAPDAVPGHSGGGKAGGMPGAPGAKLRHNGRAGQAVDAETAKGDAIGEQR